MPCSFCPAFQGLDFSPHVFLGNDLTSFFSKAMDGSLELPVPPANNGKCDITHTPAWPRGDPISDFGMHNSMLYLCFFFLYYYPNGP